jgi:predicted phage terminase large subunit-like protein
VNDTLPPDKQAKLDELCINHFDAFAERAFRVINPGVRFGYNWHVGCISDYLTACYEGEILRLCINIAPRMLKSFLVSVSFPAWVFGRQPWSKFMMTTYKSDLSKDMTQNCRAIIKDPWYQHLFPQTRISATQDEKHHFETTLHGQYYGSAINSVVGIGTDWLLLDDPLRPDEAASDTIRKSTNDAIRNTLFSRFNDRRTGRFILIMQRLHEDDPTGNLMKDGGYTLLKLPAETKTKIYIPPARSGLPSYTMEENSLLFPQRLDRDMLDRLRVELSEFHYVGQYLQNPAPIGGGEFKETWCNFYQDGGVKPRTMNLFILCDPAGGDEINKRKKKSSDYTAMMVVGLAPDNNYYLLDMVRDRLNPTERVDLLFVLHRKWNDLAGKPPKVGYEKYGMMSDTHYVLEKQKQDSYRFPLIELGGRIPKETRIRRLIPDMQQGRWWFPANLQYADNEGRTFDLVRELIYSELLNFPMARYDDMIDCISRIYSDELQAVFPRVKQSETQKMIAAAYPQEAEDWISF